jgi:hypothetical protein
MKVVKAGDVPKNHVDSEGVDKKRVAQMQEKFDSMKQLIDTKEYGIVLDSELATYLFEEFYPTINWKGYESYAVTESYNQMKGIENEGSVNGKVRPEIVEAIFHFIKSYVGSGVKSANLFKRMADQFAVTIQEINNDRQELKDISLELIAVEKGISVEQLTGELQKDPNFLG